MSLISMFVNYTFNKGDTKRDEGHITPADIQRHDNLSYGPHGKWNLLDVYYPKFATEAMPVIINVHGGGWVYGTKEVYQFYCMSLAQMGFAVVNYNYRLAPKAKFPAQLEDLCGVVKWVHSQSEYPMDLENIFMVGDSAGAHLTALYCGLLTSEGYAESLGLEAVISGLPETSLPRAVALNCGIYDMVELLAGDGKMMKWLLKDLLPRNKKIGQPSVMDSVNPIIHINKDFPPAFVMTSNEDFLLAQGPILDKHLTELGIGHDFKVYGDESVSLGHVFHCDIRSNAAKECNHDQMAFFKSHVRRQTTA